jgi:hypothetical protein
MQNKQCLVHGMIFCNIPFDDYTHRFSRQAEETGEKYYVRIPNDLDMDIIPRGIREQLFPRSLIDFRSKMRCRDSEVKDIHPGHVQRFPPTGELNKLLKKLKKGKKSKEKCRLSLFNGVDSGSFTFDYSVWEQIKEARAIDIINEVALFDNEIALSDEGIVFFVEVDYRIPMKSVFNEYDIPNEEQTINDALIIQNVVRKYFSDVSFVFMTAPLKMKEMGTIYAIGTHLIFYNIIVNSSTGAQICKDIKNTTKLDVDVQPYKRSSASLRPAYSRKIIDCEWCEKDQRLMYNCEYCNLPGRDGNGPGQLGCGSFYTANAVFDSEGVARPYNNEPTSIIPDIPGQFTPKLIPEIEKLSIQVEEKQVAEIVAELEPKKASKKRKIVGTKATKKDIKKVSYMSKPTVQYLTTWINTGSARRMLSICNITNSTSRLRLPFRRNMIPFLQALLKERGDDSSIVTHEKHIMNNGKATTLWEGKTVESRQCPSGLTHTGENFFFTRNEKNGYLYYHCRRCTESRYRYW